jgi:hypothetical protein
MIGALALAALLIALRLVVLPPRQA